MKVAFFYPGTESIGIQYLVSFLKNSGHECKLFYDPKLFNETTMISSGILSKLFDLKNILLKRFINYDADMVCFSVVSDEYNWAIEMATRIKQVKNIPVVFGGIHPTSVPEIVIQEHVVDFVVRGEGEHTLLELIEKIDKDYSDIKNLCFMKDGKIIINDVRPPIAVLDSLPMLDKEFFYKESQALKAGYLIMTARGCPFNCTYCNNNIMKKLYKTGYLRRRSVDNVLSELSEAKQKYGFDHIKFIDEVFTVNESWLQEFSEKYPQEIGLPFFVSAHPNTIDEDIAKLLKKSMCFGVVMGVQCTNYRVNKTILNRNTRTEQIVAAIKLIRKYDMKCMIDLIFGLPGLTEEEIAESLHVLHAATPDFIRTFWLSYYPRTDIINTAKAYGLLTDQNIHDIEVAKDVKGVIKAGHTYRKETIRIIILKAGLYNVLGLFPAPLLNILSVKFICSIKGLKYHTYADRAKLKYKEFIPKILAQKTRYGQHY